MIIKKMNVDYTKVYDNFYFNFNFLTFENILSRSFISNGYLSSCLDLILINYPINEFNNGHLFINYVNDFTLDVYCIFYCTVCSDFRYNFLESYFYDLNTNRVKIIDYRQKFKHKGKYYL